jgi:hypothetical protein
VARARGPRLLARRSLDGVVARTGFLEEQFRPEVYWSLVAIDVRDEVRRQRGSLARIQLIAIGARHCRACRSARRSDGHYKPCGCLAAGRSPGFSSLQSGHGTAGLAAAPGVRMVITNPAGALRLAHVIDGIPRLGAFDLQGPNVELRDRQLFGAGGVAALGCSCATREPVVGSAARPASNGASARKTFGLLRTDAKIGDRPNRLDADHLPLMQATRPPHRV